MWGLRAEGLLAGHCPVLGRSLTLEAQWFLLSFQGPHVLEDFATMLGLPSTISHILGAFPRGVSESLACGSDYNHLVNQSHFRNPDDVIVSQSDSQHSQGQVFCNPRGGASLGLVSGPGT